MKNATPITQLLIFCVVKITFLQDKMFHGLLWFKFFGFFRIGGYYQQTPRFSNWGTPDGECCYNDTNPDCGFCIIVTENMFILIIMLIIIIIMIRIIISKPGGRASTGLFSMIL